MSDPVSDPANGPLQHPLPAAALEAFREHIADHVAAITAATRDLQAAASSRDMSPDRGAASTPILYVLLTPPSDTALYDTTIHMPIYKTECPPGTVPIIIVYEGGSYGDGETIWVQDTVCL